MARRRSDSALIASTTRPAPPIAITVSGSTMTIRMKSQRLCAAVSRTIGGTGMRVRDGGAPLLAGKPSHRRHQQVAVRHVRQEGVAGEVAVADHHGSQRRLRPAPACPRPRSPSTRGRTSATGGAAWAARGGGTLDRARIRRRHRPRIAVAAALQDRRHLHAGRRLRQGQRPDAGEEGQRQGTGDRVRVVAGDRHHLGIASGNGSTDRRPPPARAGRRGRKAAATSPASGTKPRSSMNKALPPAAR